MKAGLNDVNITLWTFIAFDEDALGTIELGSGLRKKNILPCLISSLYCFKITQLAISVSDIDIPTFEAYISAGTNEIISSSMDLIFKKYKQLMIDLMPEFFLLQWECFPIGWLKSTLMTQILLVHQHHWH